jgi:formate hydrogenlyase subunit 3/multisubunit Na+/H+ antiporter MnhD subunit
MSADTPTHLWALLGVPGVLALCAVLAAVLHRRSLAFVYPVCIGAAGAACLIEAYSLFTAREATLHLPLGLPSIGVTLRLDALSAYFGLIVNIGVVAAAVYGLGFDRKELSGRVEPFFPAFAAAMNLVLLADDAFSFLFCWELMSLTSWALVVSRHQDADCRKAGHIYLIMALIGTMALLFAFGGMAGAAGGYAFDMIRSHHLDTLGSGLVLAAALVGTGSKAGLMPLHAWLPLAHPVAPSHVSALMSGVMTKVAVYAIVRIVFDLLGEPVWWWSVPFIAIGAATAVGGLLYAILDEELKRVLAFSTVENIGIIFVGIGLALAFKTTNLPAAAAVAMAGALLHAINHSWFKSLLFLGAGAVLHATGRKDFDGLGGLIHRMPQTTFYFLVGALAISALPPLNGFVSEWLLFQSVLAGPQMPEPVLRFLSPAVGALLALAAGLAAACFVRVFGIVFLSRPRSLAAANAVEAPAVQRGAMALLATLCIMGGLFGSVMVSAIAPLLTKLIGVELPGAAAGPTPFSLAPFGPVRSIYDAPIIALFVAISASLTALFVHWISNRRVRRGPAWDCGYPEPSPAAQYSASSFSQPLRRVYGRISFGAVETVDMPAPGDMRPAILAVHLKDYIWRWLYALPAAGIGAIAGYLNFLQFLTIRRYLVLMFSALIMLLLINVMRS